MPGFLRPAILTVALAGAVVSAGLVLRVGSRNPSRILIALFVVWVLSPFAVLAGAHVVAKRWPVRAQAALGILMTILTAASVILYAEVAFGPPRAKPAFLFLVVPFVSWLAIGVVVPLAARLGSKPRP